MARNQTAVDDLLDRCSRALEEGKPEDALRLAEQAGRLAPKSFEVQLALAHSLGELGRFDDALAAYDRALDMDKRSPDALLGAADLLVTALGEDPDAIERALELCERGAKVARKAGDEGLEAEFLLIEGLACNQMGDARAALERFDRALEVLGPDPEVLLERGMALFELCRFDEARRQLEGILLELPDEPWIHHYLGLLAERRGELAEAEKRFARARELDSEAFPEPVRLSETAFDKVVEDALERLPKEVRDYLSNVAIAVEPIPKDEDLLGEDPPLSPTILGVFRGAPGKDKGVMDPWAHFPSSIVLYQRNLERFAEDREHLLEEIDTTLLHEVGHYLGFDEEDLEKRGLD